MGAWSHEPFDNDDAVDLLAQIGGKGLFAIGAVLQPALIEDCLDAPDASRVVAAAALVAAAQGVDLSLPRSALEALARLGDIPHDLVFVARTALQRVVANSELEALWAEGEGYDDWLAGVSRIQQALT